MMFKPMQSRYAGPASRYMTAFMSSLLLLGGSAQALADAASPVAPAAQGNGYSVSLKELGRNYPMVLKGVESADTVNFNVRADQVVTGARLTLEYSYSPALLADMSQLNVMVNDEVAASLPLVKEGAGKPQKQVIDIPGHLITEFNRLSLQFVGHYSMSCEDPMHSSLWARVSPASRLELQTQPLNLPDDLSILPLPFFDRRDMHPVTLPFVFASGTDNATLEAAGALSSWFGAQASYRGASFPVSLSELPASGNAVVLRMTTSAGTLGNTPVPAPSGPSVALLANPNDPNGKLLLISGRDAKELKTAATAVVMGSHALSGSQVVITQLETLQARKPYDAPNWVPSDRPVKLGELLETKSLSVSGYNPNTISVPLRLPPDLFNWRQEGVPLDLKYRYTPQPRKGNSSLIVSFNDNLVKSENLPSTEQLDSSLLGKIRDEVLPRDTHARLPLEALSLQSRLQFRFMYEFMRQGECGDIIIDNMRGSIDPESTVDLSGYDHFMAMPNLGVFKDAGFPFTRMADLSQSAVVLPDNAGVEELGAYLDILGRFGESTGYPATAVTVTQAAQVSQVADKDLLVLASGANQPLLEAWSERMPAQVNGAQSRVELSDLAFKVRNWFSSDPEANLRQARLAMSFSAEHGSSFLTGFESPLKSGRSVVVIASSRPQDLADVTRAMVGGEDYTQAIQGSLVAVRGKSVQALVADEQYYIGQLGTVRYVQWILSRNLAVSLLATALSVAVLASLAFLALRARARRRLNP